MIGIMARDWGMVVSGYKTFVLVILALLSAQLWATPGIITNHNNPRYTGENRTLEEDMRVKVPGGYFRVTRSWTENGWYWNRRLADLEFFEIVNPGTNCQTNDPVREYSINESETTDGSFGCLPTEDLTAVVGIGRADEPYVFDADPRAWFKCVYRMSANASGTDGSGSISLDSPFLIPIDCDNQTFYSGGSKLIATYKGEDYTWTDREGNQIKYDGKGRVQYYQDRNDVRVTINRFDDGRVSNVVDNNGDLVVTFLYEHPTFTKAITRVVDYTGREVVYSYTDETLSDDQYPLLESVTDVRGETWTYEYTNRVLSARIDPETNKTTFTIGQKGIMTGYKNADGVGVTFTHSTDNGKEEYIQRVTQSDGVVTETWTNKLGHVTRRDINGETQFTAQYIMNDGTDGVSEANTQRTAGVKTGVSSFKRVSSTGTNSKSGPSMSWGGSISQSEEYERKWLKTKIVKDRWGLITKTTYDQYGNMTRVDHPDGSYESWSYHDDYNFVTQYRDSKGVITRYDYFTNGNLQRETAALGTDQESIVEYTYRGDGELATVTYVGDSNPNTLTQQALYQYFYDSRGNLEKSIDPANHEVDYQDYDVNGNAWSIIDERDKTWRYEFDAVGNLTKEVSPLALQELHEYDGAGRYVKHTAANTAETLITPNASGLPLVLTDKLGHSLTLGYDAANRVRSVKDANSNLSSLKYDAQGRLDETIDGEGNIIDYQYENGLLSTITYPTFAETFGYDKRKRMDSISKQANGVVQKRSWAFNSAHERTGYVDAETNSSSTYYDALGRVNREVDATQGETLYRYDDRGNLLYVRDPETRETNFTYNALDQLIQEDLPQGQTRAYDYWENGLLKTIIHGDGRVSYFTYDDDSRLTNTYYYDNVAAFQADPQNTQSAKNITFTYHELGGIETYNDGTTSATYVYNDIGLLQTVTVNYGAFSKTHSYTYHPNRSLQSYTNPESVKYTYLYNGNGQITSITIPDQGQIAFSNYTWLFNDRINLPGGAHIEKTPDGLMRFQSNRLYDPANNSLFDATYGYDLENNITTIASTQGDEGYQYDDLYRLQQATQPESTETFRYDDVGNRVAHNGATENWVYNEDNQLVSRPGVTYEYNSNGHLWRRTEGSTVTTFEYNHEERLDRVLRNGTEIARYYYDPFGRRLWKEVSGTRRYFLYNHSGMVGEYDASGNLIQEYHYTPGRPWGTDPVFTRVGGAVYYYMTDHRFAPRRLVDKSGKVVWSANYEAFGQAVETVTTVSNPLRLAGQYHDAETGLHYNYYRDYDPSIGRYIQVDPLGFEGGLNKYAYALLNPLNRVDPDGQVAPLVIALIRQGIMMAARQYMACLGRCLLAAGITAGADAALEMLIGCDGKDLGDEFVEAAKGCATACLNPWNWRAGKNWNNIKSKGVDWFKKRRNIERRHSTRKEAKEAANHAHGGKPKPTPKKDASSDKKKEYAEQQKYKDPESHPDSAHPEPHFHDSNKSSAKDNNHHTYPKSF